MEPAALREPERPAARLRPFSLGAQRVRLAEAADSDAIAALNHRTFVQELGQYEDDGSGPREDKFHAKNHYLLCERGGELVGMVAVHDQAPFSVSSRLPGGERVEDLSARPLEVRLLCVRPDQRGGRVALALMYAVLRFCRENGHDDLWISGVTAQQPLYRRLGFRPVGPDVPQGEVAFAPMRLRLADVPSSFTRVLHGALQRGDAERSAQEWLPGPPRLAGPVAAVLRERPLYHRDPAFLDAFREVRRALSAWTDGMEAAPFAGSGTAANDGLAALLARLPRTRGRRGLVLSNGEFGARLVRHARAAGLDFDVLEGSWGRAWDLDAALARVDAAGPGWVWGVQLETSTGALNPAQALGVELARRGVPLVLDAVSALGAVPLPTGTLAASGVSGKALGGLAGLAWVAVDPSAVGAAAAAEWPPALDLPRQWRSAEPCHTLPSPQLLALREALLRWSPADRRGARFERYRELGRRVRAGLRAAGLEPLVPDAEASPVVTTFPVPAGTTTEEFLARMQGAGHRLAGASRYLRERGWAQVATLGEVSDADLEDLLAALR